MLHLFYVIVEGLHEVEEGHELGTFPKTIQVIIMRGPVNDHDVVIGFFMAMNDLVTQAILRCLQVLRCIRISHFKTLLVLFCNIIPDDLY